METSRRRYLFLFFLLFPVIWIIGDSRRHCSGNVVKTHPVASGQSSDKSSAGKSFALTRHHASKNMNAQQYYQLTGNNTSTPPPISGMTSGANLLCDNAVGDTSTGYTDNTPNTRFYEYGAIDLGTPTAVHLWEVAGTILSATNANAYLYGSNDGINWTGMGGQNVGGNTSGNWGGFAPTAYTYRYFLAQIYDNGHPGTATISFTDFRLYDSTGTVIGPPSGSSSSKPVVGGGNTIRNARVRHHHTPGKRRDFLKEMVSVEWRLACRNYSPANKY